MNLLDRIATVCGDDVSLFLTQRFVGQRLRIPQRFGKSHPLAELGIRGKLLCYYFGGDRVVIGGRWVPNSLIESRLRSGASVEAIADELRLNRRTVYRRIQSRLNHNKSR